MTNESCITGRRKTLSRRVRLLARAGLGAGLLVLLATRADFTSLSIDSPRQVAAAIAIAIVLLIAAQAFSALRWRIILGASSPPWSYLFRVYLIGQFVSLFLPTSIGGDAFRAAAVSRASSGVGEAISGVVLDRLFGVLALVAYFLIGLGIAPSSRDVLDQLQWSPPSSSQIFLLIGAVGAIGVALLIAARTSRIRNVLVRGLQLTHRVVRSPGVLVAALGVSLVVQAIYIGVWAAIARSIGVDIPLGFLLISVPLVSLAAMLPITVSGVGVREGVWALLLSLIGVSSSRAIASSLLYFLAFVLVGAIGGLWFMLGGVELRTEPKD